MFVHLIQFDEAEGLDLGLLDEGAHLTLGLSRLSRLCTRLLRGSGEHPVDTSGDLTGERQRRAAGGFINLKCEKVIRSHRARVILFHTCIECST